MPIEHAGDLILPACYVLVQSLTQDPFYRAITVEAEDETGRAVLLARYFGLAIAEAEGCGEVQYAGADCCAIWITNEAGPAQARQCSERRNAALWPLLGQRGHDRYARICENMAARALCI